MQKQSELYEIYIGFMLLLSITILVLFFNSHDGEATTFTVDDDDGSAMTAVYDTKKLNYGNQTLLKSNRYMEWR